MAVRTPLYWNGSDIQEMSSAQIDQIVDQTIYQYSLNPSVSLSVVASGGSLGTMTDTRYKSGTAATSTGDGVPGDGGAAEYPSESTTGEPQLVSTNFSKINQTTATTSQITDTSNKAFPVFYSSGSIQSMSLTDMQDTFFKPAIDLLTTGAVSGTQQAGTYIVSTSSSVTGYTEVSGTATPIFTDTKADVAGYLASNIGTSGTTQDVNTTVSSYYLHRRNGSDTSYQSPLYINGTDLQTYTDASFETILQNGIRHMATSTTGYRIGYSITSSADLAAATNNRGELIDSVLTGVTGNYQTRFVNVDDYRAQEFPNGTLNSNAGYVFAITKS